MCPHENAGGGGGVCAYEADMSRLQNREGHDSVFLVSVFDTAAIGALLAQSIPASYLASYLHMPSRISLSQRYDNEENSRQGISMYAQG